MHKVLYMMLHHFMLFTVLAQMFNMMTLLLTDLTQVLVTDTCYSSVLLSPHLLKIIQWLFLTCHNRNGTGLLTMTASYFDWRLGASLKIFDFQV